MGDIYVSGKIISMVPSTTDEIQFYVVPNGVEINGKIFITNVGLLSTNFSLAWCDANHGDNAANSDDWIFKGTPITLGQFIELNITLGSNESIRVQTSNANTVSFCLSGIRKIVQ